MTIDTLIKNINIATMDESLSRPYGEISNGCVTINNGLISQVGESKDFKSIEAKQVINGDGLWMTPGLIDCHTHLVYGGNRASEFELKLSGASYEEISLAGGGIVSTVNATRELNEENLYRASAPRLIKLLAEGVTTVEIKSGYGLNLDDELKMLRVARQLQAHFPVNIRTTFLGAHALPKEFNHKDDYIQHLIDVVLPRVKSENLADAVDFFCEGIGFSREQCARYGVAAKNLGLPIKGHVEQLSYLAGATLVAELEGISVDHLEYLPLTDIKILKQANLVAVLLPGAFYSLRETQKPPIAEMLAADLPIAIATDLNPGSSPIASLLTILNLACVLYRLTPETALKAVTINAAKALAMQAEVGQVKSGLRADLILWPIDSPAELCYGINLTKPSMIFKDGICVDKD